LSYHPQSIQTLSGNKYAGSHEVVYGTDKGVLGQMFLSDQAMKRGWFVPAQTSGRVLGIDHIHPGVDVNRDGMSEYVITRQDGTLEVYAMDEMGTVENIFKRPLGEPVTALDSGSISTHRTEELVVQTTSGRIASFGLESMADRPSSARIMSGTSRRAEIPEDGEK
jgi:hypothetical protein